MPGASPAPGILICYHSLSSALTVRLKPNAPPSIVFQATPRLDVLWFKAASIPLLLLIFSSYSADCQTSQNEIAQHFRAGQHAMQRGEFAQAAEEFKKVLSLDPTLVEAEVNLGLAYHSASEYELAVRQLSKALQQRPRLLGANVIAGSDYVKLGSPDKAVPFLQHALKLDPLNPEAHQALAAAYLALENFRGAAEEFHQLAALDPDKSEAWFKLGHEYLDLSARLAYRGARLYPESAWGHRFLGDLLFQRGRWDESANEYQKALNIDQQVKGLHTSLGEVYLHAAQLDKAHVEFQAEIQLDKTSVRAWLGLAETQLAQNRPDVALASASQAWRISSDFVALQREFPTVAITPDMAKRLVARIDSAADTPAKHFLLAALYAIGEEGAQAERESKQFQAAVVATQESVHTTEANVCQINNYSACIRLLRAKKILGDSQRLLLGKSEFAMRQYESAAKSLPEVGGVSKQNAEASYWLSRTYQALGADAFTQLQETYPDSWRTHQLRGEGNALKGNYNDATKEFQAALQMKPDSAELYEALGELYLDNHSEVDAEKDLHTAVTLDPSRSRALYLLGRLYVQQRDNDKAVPFLQRALRLEPDFAEASSLLGTALMRLGRYADAVPNLNNAAQVDHYGNVHYQLYVAYKKLGNTGLAQKALARSQDIRRSSLEHDQAIIMGAPQVDTETQ
jgi:tetratricopeptide (TPR) repeat protein